MIRSLVLFSVLAVSGMVAALHPAPDAPVVARFVAAIEPGDDHPPGHGLGDICLPRREAPNVAELLQRTIVKVRVRESYGTGIVFRASDNSLWVWTAAHVIFDLRQEDGSYAAARVVAQDGTTVPARVVRACFTRDIALLQLDDQINVVSATFHTGPRPRLGTYVYSAGHPRGYDFSVGEGIISHIGRNRGGSAIFDQTTATASFGSSGGAVALRENGHILGITSRGDPQTIHLYVPTWVVREFAQTEGLLFALDNTLPVPADVPVPGPAAEGK